MIDQQADFVRVALTRLLLRFSHLVQLQSLLAREFTRVPGFSEAIELMGNCENRMQE